MSEKNKIMLKQMLFLSPKRQREFLNTVENSFILFLCECVLNVLEGNVKVTLGKLTPFEKELRILKRRSTPYSTRRQVLQTNKGLKLLKLIGKPCINYLDLCHGS